MRLSYRAPYPLLGLLVTVGFGRHPAPTLRFVLGSGALFLATHGLGGQGQVEPALIPGDQWATARYPEGPEGVCEPLPPSQDCGLLRADDLGTNGPVLWKPQALRCEPAEPVPHPYWATTITYFYAQSFFLKFPYKDPMTGKCFMCTTERGKNFTWYKGVRREIRENWLAEVEVVNEDLRMYSFYEYNQPAYRGASWTKTRLPMTFIVHKREQQLHVSPTVHVVGYNAEFKRDAATTHPLRCTPDASLSNILLGDIDADGESENAGGRLFPAGARNPGIRFFRFR